MNIAIIGAGPAGIEAASILADKHQVTLFEKEEKPLCNIRDKAFLFPDFSSADELADKLEKAAISLYSQAADYAIGRGIIVADTKFEFGLDEQGGLVLADEVLTPDSSRFWPVASYTPGKNPPSLDKQFVRDWLDSVHFNHQPPAPELPQDIVEKTAEKYRNALEVLKK